MDELLTRDGKVVRGLGTWELEQLAKIKQNPKQEEPTYKGIRYHENNGRYKPHYTVRATRNSNYIRVYVHHFGSKSEALKEALKIREAILKDVQK